MHNPSVSAVIINYNSRDLIKPCMESLLAQTWPNLQIIFIDNNSADGSYEYFTEHFKNNIAVHNNTNFGYTYAGNQGIRLAASKYMMLMNPDIILAQDYIQKCVEKMESDPKIGSITGKIYKYDFQNNRKTDYIDTVGLLVFRNRRVIDDGQGMQDKGQFDHEKEVFGISGACPLYRKEALEDVKVFHQYLDEDFFMYKEDVDLAWRLRLFGWKAVYLPSALAWHGRGTGVLKRFTHIEVAKNRSKLSRFTKHHSYRNQRWMQLKNEFAGSVARSFFPIIWKEILIGGYMVLREPFLFKSFWQMLRGLGKMLKKRKYIFAHKRVSSAEMEKWLNNKKSAYQTEHEKAPKT